MNFLESTKTDAKSDIAVASNETHSHEIDTLGYAHASIDILFSPFTAAAGGTTAATVLKLQESNVSGSGQADISGFVGGTDFTVGAAVTATSSVGYACRFDIDLRGHKRYLTIAATPVSAVGIVTVARLSKGTDGPVSASQKNVTVAVSG